MEKICEQCNSKYKSNKKTSRFCCHTCYLEYISKNKYKDVICRMCKNKFRVHLSSNRIFCCKKCSDNFTNKKLLKKCLICGKEFLIKKSRIKIGCGKYCSNNCKVKGYIGFKHSEETKENLSTIKQGSWLGDNNPKWKGGISNLNKIDRGSRKTKIWKESIRQLFNYTCQRCGKKGGNINAHHINNWADNISLRYDISNGIIFCEKCHKEFHKKYGKENNNIFQVKEFINIYE